METSPRKGPSGAPWRYPISDSGKILAVQPDGMVLPDGRFASLHRVPPPGPKTNGGTDDSIAINTLLDTKPDSEYWIFVTPFGAVYDIRQPIFAISKPNSLWTGGAIFQNNIINPIDNIEAVFTSGVPQGVVPANLAIHFDAPVFQGFVFTVSIPTYVDPVTSLITPITQKSQIRLQTGNTMTYRNVKDIDNFGVARAVVAGTSDVSITTIGNPSRTAPFIIRVVNPGIISIPGITYQVSTDGILFGPVTPLGGGNTIDIVAGGGTTTAHFTAGTLVSEDITILTKITLSASLPGTFLALGSNLLVVLKPRPKDITIDGLFFEQGSIPGPRRRFISYVGTEDVTITHCTFDCQGANSQDCFTSSDLGNERNTWSDNTYLIDDTTVSLATILQLEHSEFAEVIRNKFLCTAGECALRAINIWANYKSIISDNECGSMLVGVDLEGGIGLEVSQNHIYSRNSTNDTVGILQSTAGDVPDDCIGNIIKENILDCSFGIQTTSNLGHVIRSERLEDNIIINGQLELQNCVGLKVNKTIFRGFGTIPTLSQVVFVKETCIGTEILNTTFDFDATSAARTNTAFWLLAPVIIDGIENLNVMPHRAFYFLDTSGGITDIKNWKTGCNPGIGGYFDPTWNANGLVRFSNIDWDPNTGNPGLLVENTAANASIEVSNVRALSNIVGGNGAFTSDVGSTLIVNLKNGNNFSKVTNLTGGAGTTILSRGISNTDAGVGTTEVFYRFDNIGSQFDNIVSIEWVANTAVGALDWRRDFTNANQALRGIYFRSTSAADTNLGVRISID